MPTSKNISRRNHNRKERNAMKQKNPTPSPYGAKGFQPVEAPRPKASGVSGKVKTSDKDLRTK